MKIICRHCLTAFEPFLPHNQGDFGHSCPKCGTTNTYEESIGSKTITYKQLWEIINQQEEDSKGDQGTYSVSRALNGILLKVKEIYISETKD